jgi:hypothetical protein
MRSGSFRGESCRRVCSTIIPPPVKRKDHQNYILYTVPWTKGASETRHCSWLACFAHCTFSIAF